MSEDKSNKKRTKKKHRKWLVDCERRSDRRTAEYLARRFDELQEELADLIPDLRTFEHYSEIEDLSWCLMLMQRLKRKYKGFADDGVWSDS